MKLVEVRISWPGHPRYQKKKKKIVVLMTKESAIIFVTYERLYVTVIINKLHKT